MADSCSDPAPSPLSVKAAGIESIGLAPQLLVTVNSIDRHVNRRSGTDLLIAKLHVSPRRADDQCRRRIEAHRFLYDLARVSERVYMVWMNRTASVAAAISRLTRRSTSG